MVACNVGLSPNQINRVKVEDTDHSNLEDLFIAEYADRREGRELNRLFLDLDLSKNLQTVGPDIIQAVFALGFPTFARTNDLQLDNDGIPIKCFVKTPWVKIYLRVDESKLLDTENRIPMIQDEQAGQETIDPDGMSGSPVFFIGKSEGHDAFLGFAGMITEAHERRFMVYDAAILKQVLDSCIDEPKVP